MSALKLGFVHVTTFIVLACLLLIASADAKAPLKVGDVPPDKLGRSAAGEKLQISDYRGKIVIISFWASWCPPCRKELPMLAGINKAADHEKLAVIAVNWHESTEQFRAIKKALKDVDLTMVSDSNGRLGDQFGVKSIPHMIIIGRDGKIAAIHIGYSESELPALVEEINTLWLESTT